MALFRRHNVDKLAGRRLNRGLLWAQLRNSTAFWLASGYLMLLILVALGRDFIANDKPLYCQYQGQTYFPALRDVLVDLGWAKWEDPFIRADWRNLQFDAPPLYPPIRFQATQPDTGNAPFVGPFDEQKNPEGYFHYLGTDQIGRDIAAGMVSGTRIAVKVALIAMSIAALLGILLGGMAGYFGDYTLKTSRLRQVFLVLGLILGFFWGFSSRQAYFWAGIEEGRLWWQLSISLAVAMLITFLFYQLGKGLERWLKIRPERPVYVDYWVLRAIEVLNSIPGLFLLLAALAIIKVPTIFNLMVVIGLISWTGIARFVRAELLRIRTLDYIQAGRVMGFSDFRLLFLHAFPNAIGPVLVTIAFGMAGAIMLESTLSFLGIGSSADQISWGSLLKLARGNPTAWWLALFPGMAVFFTVLAFNTLGEALTNAMSRSAQ